jgi:hypothetical protein
MPLVRLKDEYLEQEDGVRFLMADELGNTVACKVSHEALRAHAEREHFAGTDSTVFQAYRELIEDLMDVLWPSPWNLDVAKVTAEHGTKSET